MSCYNSFIQFNVLWMEFIITQPQIQSSLFISALVFSTFKLQLSSPKKGPTAQEEGWGEKAREAERATLTGSISTQLGYSNPYVYNQFSLQTIEQRINQIILLQVGTRSKRV